MNETDMWNKASFLTRLVASSVRVSEAAGGVIKNVMAGGDLKIVDKSTNGEPSDPQTEADRRAQFLIVKSLTERFGGINIIGEEVCEIEVQQEFQDVTSDCNSIEKTFSSDVLQLEDQIGQDLKSIKPEEVGVLLQVSHSYLLSINYEQVVVWVDPLDGTSEVAVAVKNKNAALLEQVTVLIGIAYHGRPVAGVIHQPYHGGAGRTIWAIRGCGVHGIVPAPAQSAKVVVTTRSHLNQNVLDALDALKEKGLASNVEKFGGAGFKVLKVLEGCAAYVFASKGCKKWDTCAVEAVLCAAGGRLTDISGRDLCYDASVQRNNTGGVLASAPWVNHEEYIKSIPQSLKDQLPEVAAKS
ncbi:inositol monophosphatase family protein [Ancylostoma caninum]|uniref:3'(2'),5'-bisphosphate nucleotidase 1 n=1 Tax=Ancylostoma caninum TaxID=29170 RepID=A0A368GBX1_ANCCA|nr:inositol monophosphatase family protein [Ancylostoma caninum]